MNHAIASFDEDGHGFTTISCTCGWQEGAFDEDAYDAIIDHAYEAGIEQARQP